MSKIIRDERCHAIRVDIIYPDSEDKLSDISWIDRILYNPDKSMDYLKDLNSYMCNKHNGINIPYMTNGKEILCAAYTIQITIWTFESIEVLTQFMSRMKIYYDTTNATQKNSETIQNLMEEIFE